MLTTVDKAQFYCTMVSSWVQLLFPKPWKEFRLWYGKHKEEGTKPYLELMEIGFITQIFLIFIFLGNIIGIAIPIKKKKNGIGMIWIKF